VQPHSLPSHAADSDVHGPVIDRQMAPCIRACSLRRAPAWAALARRRVPTTESQIAGGSALRSSPNRRAASQKRPTSDEYFTSGLLIKDVQRVERPEQVPGDHAEARRVNARPSLRTRVSKFGHTQGIGFRGGDLSSRARVVLCWLRLLRTSPSERSVRGTRGDVCAAPAYERCIATLMTWPSGLRTKKRRMPQASSVIGCTIS
jgi:hypothetical protein